MEFYRAHTSEDTQVNTHRSLSTTLVLSVLFSTLGIPALAAETPTRSASSAEVKATHTLPKTTKSWIKTKKYKRVTSRKGHTVVVEYPMFSGEPKESIAALNKQMKKFVNKHMPIVNIHDETGGTEFSYECSYGIQSLTPDLISVDMNFYSFTGGAHGNAWTVPFNYKLTANGPKEITIANVFGKKPDLKALQNLIRPRLWNELYPDDDGGDREWIESGTAELADFQCISVDKEGVTFNFQQYQVACYAAGAPSITLTYAELQDQFAPSSPVYCFVKAATNLKDVNGTKKAMK
jgi:hypothetical protein